MPRNLTNLPVFNSPADNVSNLGIYINIVPRGKIPSHIDLSQQKYSRKSSGYRNQNSRKEHYPHTRNLDYKSFVSRRDVPKSLVIMNWGLAMIASLVESTI